jgi:hypothetical protein
MKKVSIFLWLALLAPTAFADWCWQEASLKSGVPVEILVSVVSAESSFNPKAVNYNKDKARSKDVGATQINSQWLPVLKRYGINEADLYDACTNLKVGAWLMQRNIDSMGWSWDTVGAHNVGCRGLAKNECHRRRMAYAWKIHGEMVRFGFAEPAPGEKIRSRRTAPRIPGYAYSVLASDSRPTSQNIEPDSSTRLVIAEFDQGRGN